MKFYNHRNSKGQFTRRVARTKDGRFTEKNKIVAGRLYSYLGVVVRALKPEQDTDLRLVSFHKKLFGFAKDSDLKKITKREVNKYLEAA